MAKINGSVSQRADSYTFYIEWSESKASDYISTNKTTVTATAYVTCSAHTAWASGLAQKLVIDGTTFTATKTVDLSSGVKVALVTGSKTITHSTDGSKKITISADCDLPDGSGWGPAWGSASATVSLTTIPRYATSVQSMKSKTETSITMNWSSDSTIDYIWYSTNNGSNWTGINVTDGKSGSYTISSLSANTTYKIKTRVRRKDSQLTTDSSELSITTYDYPYCTDTPNFIIGEAVTLKFYNPLGREFKFYVIANGTQLSGEWTISGTSYTGINSEETSVPQLYLSIPNDSSGKYKIKVVYGTSTKIRDNGNTYRIDASKCMPTFSSCTYEDVGNISTQLTGDNQIIINGCNELQVTISRVNKAIAKNGATMSKYRLVCGNDSKEGNYSENDDVVLKLNNITNMTFMVYAIDSRGLSTPVISSISEENWKNYSGIVITSASIERNGGVGTDATLTFRGTIWNNTFGAVENEIVKCQYKYKKSNESTYGDPIDITPTRGEDLFSFNSTIKGDLDANGFNASNSFNIEIIITDKIKTATYNILLGAGTPAMAIHRDGVSFGAPYDEKQGGLIQFLANKYLSAGGAINMNNSDIINANCIWMNDEAEGHEGINFLKQRWRQNKSR